MNRMISKSGVPKFEEIELGSRVCKTIKETFFKDEEWAKCCYKVADKFTQLKVIMRKVLPDAKDSDRLEMISKYSSEDLEDAFSHLVGDYIPRSVCEVMDEVGR